MNLSTLTIKQSLNKAYRLLKPKRNDIERFKQNLIGLLGQIDEKETEENVKIHLMDFLKNTWYSPDFLVATKGKTDFVLHTGKDAKSPSGVLFEVKRPSNKGDMVTQKDLNKKALQELVLYYLRERHDGHNTDLRHLVITNIYEWFVFDAAEFERVFGKSTPLKKSYESWKAGQKVSTNTDLFYKEIAKPFIDQLTEPLTFTYFDIREFEKPLRSQSLKDDNHLIGLFKILSPTHLLKLPFTNDSNSLDRGFYAELLHLIGLEEVKEGNKKLIRRKAAGKRQPGSLLENAIINIESEDLLSNLPNPGQYGATQEERLYNVALELCITWVNRVLFLKLLEAQLIKYHRQDQQFKFLNYATIPQYDELNKLFFQVLAKRPHERSGPVQQKYSQVPYLNSSLFETTEMERDIIRMSSLDDLVTLDLYPGTVLRNAQNKPLTGHLNGLEYLLRFLEAYDFASEGREEIQEESKTLINAAVLGLIFEKINGYKDGSIYTPGFITMYMCRQAIRLAVVQKFKDAYGWPLDSFDDLKNYLADHKGTAKVLEFNQLLNGLHLCDPAVGSGHFLVSALNELIACKAELGLLADAKGVRLSDYQVTVENDELLITHRATDDLFEYTVQPAPHGKGFKIDPETQRVQQTLFHEKQTIIENCLFGVDINPNSVKICRLRLWIELLKNAYYAPLSATEEGPGVGFASPVCYAQEPGLREGFASSNGPADLHLQTLPNIDINIKQGNSLISRYALDADLSKALKGVKYSVAEYRNYVQAYKNTHHKEHKRELEQIIGRIKSDFRTEITKTDPKQQKLNRLNGELINLTTQLGVFEPSAKEKKANKLQQQKLETETAKLRQEIEDIKSNAIYRNAFEWRFEFPEVLDNEGNFEGFDVVIGNPPYKMIQPGNTLISEIDGYKSQFEIADFKIDLFHLFFQIGTKILKLGGCLDYIAPSSLLINVFASNLRGWLLERNTILEIVVGEDKVFDEADVHTAIYLFKKIKPRGNEEVRFTTSFSESSINSINFKSIKMNELGLLQNGIWNLNISSANFPILYKISSHQKLDSVANINRGLITGDRAKYFSNEGTLENHVPILAGGDIFKYYSNTPNEYVLFERPKSAGGCWDKAVHLAEHKICIRQIGKEPTATLITQPIAVTGNIFTVIASSVEFEKYILSIINSKVIKFYWSVLFNDFKTTFPQVSISSLNFIPIPNATEEEKETITHLVNQILAAKAENPQADTSVWEREIDQRVYQLYDLSPEEIALVEQG
ncbi:DUF7149 domain-containing protein [Rufibacter soli]